MLSLPMILGTTLDTIPSGVPYIRADPVGAEIWRQRIGEVKELRIGINWAGRAEHGNDNNRSIQLAALAPLAGVEGVRFYSLQKDKRAEFSQGWPKEIELTDWTDDLKDFADTAALVANLDLVITVDTAVAHLAGAMGKPTWVLLPFVPDSRWMLERNDSPWYPTMRLFRQTARGDWEVPLRSITSAVRELAGKSGKRSERPREPR